MFIIPTRWGHCLHFHSWRNRCSEKQRNLPRAKEALQQADVSDAGICTSQFWAVKSAIGLGSESPTPLPMPSAPQGYCRASKLLPKSITLQKYYKKSTTNWNLELSAVALTKKINVFKLNSDSSPASPSPLQYQNMNTQNAKHETFCSFQHSEQGGRRGGKTQNKKPLLIQPVAGKPYSFLISDCCSP